jgi:hypothetical protein
VAFGEKARAGIRVEPSEGRGVKKPERIFTNAADPHQCRKESSITRPVRPQQYLTTGFDEKRCVLRARRTSFFRHFLIYGPTAHKFKRPDKTLYSVQKKSPVFAKTSYSPCISKNEALRRRFKPSKRNSCLFHSILRTQRIPLGNQSQAEKLDRLN